MAARTGPHPTVQCTGDGCAVMLRYDPRRKGTMCRACKDAAIRTPERDCERCGKPVERRRRAGPLCRSCAARAAGRVEKLRAAMKVRHSDPAYQRRRGRAISLGRLRHIPVEFHDEYMRLLPATGMTKAERTAVIRNQIEADAREFARTGILPQAQRAQTKG